MRRCYPERERVDHEQLIARASPLSSRTGWALATSAQAWQQEAGQARWRALHEVAVVADLVARLGTDTAGRYFAHEGIETWRAMVEVQKCAERLGDTPHTAVRVRQPTDRLCAWD